MKTNTKDRQSRIVRLLLSSLILFITTTDLLSAQYQYTHPVTLSYRAEQVWAQKWRVQITATMQDGWYLYSQHMEEGGPVPTKIAFAANKQVIFFNTPKELGKVVEKFEEVFGVKTRYFKNKVTFEQEVIVKADLPIEIAGEVEYMTCNGETCLPPRVELFRVVLK